MQSRSCFLLLTRGALNNELILITVGEEALLLQESPVSSSLQIARVPETQQQLFGGAALLEQQKLVHAF